MFEFVTISNGVAVVRHGATGHVYRFRPTQPGIWSKLTLDKIDVCQDADAVPSAHAGEALVFAEATALNCCEAESEVAEVPSPPPFRGLHAIMRGRASARRPGTH